MIMEKNGTNEKHRVHLMISGRVQNVGFRAYVQDVGSLLVLTGWVRNVSYNQVESVAEGPMEVLHEFINRVWQGPRGSRVDDVSIAWEPYTGEFLKFVIRTSK